MVLAMYESTLVTDGQQYRKINETVLQIHVRWIHMTPAIEHLSETRGNIVGGPWAKIRARTSSREGDGGRGQVLVGT